MHSTFMCPVSEYILKNARQCMLLCLLSLSCTLLMQSVVHSAAIVALIFLLCLFCSFSTSNVKGSVVLLSNFLCGGGSCFFFHSDAVVINVQDIKLQQPGRKGLFVVTVVIFQHGVSFLGSHSTAAVLPFSFCSYSCSALLSLIFILPDRTATLFFIVLICFQQTAQRKMSKFADCSFNAGLERDSPCS